MKGSVASIVFALLVIYWATPAIAQDQPDQPAVARQPFSFTVFWENDSNPLNRIEPSDRHYTNGTAINLSWRPQLAQDAAAYFPFAQSFGPADGAFGITLGQLMFGPENLGTKSVVTNDAPYAGYLYAGAYLQRADSDRTVLDHVQFDFGMVGEASLAEPVQKSIHEWVNSPRPNGWRHQINDEPVFQLTAVRKWRLALADNLFDCGLDVEAIPAVAVSLGTVKRQVEAGSTLRLGWNLPDDFGPARIADLANGEALARSPLHGLSFYVFGRAAGRAVQHDLFIDGSDFQREEHTMNSRPLQAEFQVGAALGYAYRSFSAELSYAVTFQTDTFYHQQYADKYAAVSLKLACWF